MPGERAQSWRGRPRFAAFVRGFAAAVPVAAGVAAAVVFSRLIDPPVAAVAKVLWWVGCFAVSSVVSWVVAGQARRLLPLAALLKLSMAFPDKAPSRYSVALRAGTVGNLKARLADVREHGIDEDAGSAAETILVLASAMNAHDKGTRGHAERVRALTEMLGDELKLEPEAQERLRWSSLLHDVGKVMVSPEILNKTGKLTAEEWSVIHRHPDDGARIAEPLKDWLGPWGLAIEQHHEKFDGTGYPRKLSGEEISLGARVVAVADAYEVMTSARSYREAMSPAEARKELARSAGTHFDPHIVRAFLNISIGRLRWIMGPLAWLAQFPFIRMIPSTGGQVAGAAATGAATLAAGVGLGMVPVEPPVPEGAFAIPAVVVPAAGVVGTEAPSGPGAHDVTPAIAAATSTTLAAPSTTRVPSAPVPTTRVTVIAPTTTTSRPNRPPVAVADSAATTTGPSKPVKIYVTANDVDPDGNLVDDVVVVVPGKLGKANGGDGAINYIPSTEVSGVDVIRYRVCDAGGLCSEANVTITITAPDSTEESAVSPVSENSPNG